MKKILYTLICLTFCSCIYAQQKGIIINGEERPAQQVAVSENPQTIQDALVYFFNKQNRKLKKRKGIYSVTEVVIKQLGTDKLDLFFDFEAQGKKRDRLTHVLMAVQSSEKQFVGAGTYSNIQEAIPVFLATIPAIVQEYQHKMEADRLANEAEKAHKEKLKLEKKAAKQAKKTAALKQKAEAAKSAHQAHQQ